MSTYGHDALLTIAFTHHQLHKTFNNVLGFILKLRTLFILLTDHTSYLSAKSQLSISRQTRHLYYKLGKNPTDERGITT